MNKDPAHPTPHPQVNRLLRDLLTGARAALGDAFAGMYLYGSLALGDFNPRSSDIDFLVATAAEVTAEQLGALQPMHPPLAAGRTKWARELEGSYIPLAALRRYRPPDTRHPHIDRGSPALQVEQHDTDWIIQRFSLREHGVTLAGPAPQTLIDPISADDLRQAVRDLMWWWELQLTDTQRVETPAYQVYTILSMCRIRYTLLHGDILSKPAAVRWALQALEPRWAGLIQAAQAWQPGPPMDHLPEPLAFIRDTLTVSQHE